MVQDAADYFRLVRRALLAARRSVFVLGWDLTAGIDLDPGAPRRGSPTRFDRLLRHIVRRRPSLDCYLLTWDYGALFTLERDPFTRFRLSWAMPRRVHFRFDDRHPVGACHHQKIVVIDDALAFCGGIDLTGHRWDTRAHRIHEPRRRTPTGKRYGPYHEVQAMFDGPAAASLGELARERWRAVDRSPLPAVAPSSERLWPAGVEPDFTGVDVGISRTVPAFDGTPAIRECEALFLDAIASARRTIYIENQYFTNTRITDALAARLGEPDGPEVIVAVPRDSHGWLEHQTVGVMRDVVFQRLAAADVHGRLRLVAPVASRAADVPIFVHSKVMLVDDGFVRVGSANVTHRSMGVDTECDVAVEAAGDEEVARGVRRIRNRLLGEHFGLSADETGRALDRLGSIRALVDERQAADRTLAAIDLPPQPVALPSDAIRLAVDPDEPVEIVASVEHLLEMDGIVRRRPRRRRWLLTLAALSAAAVVTAVVVRRRRARSGPRGGAEHG